MNRATSTRFSVGVVWQVLLAAMVCVIAEAPRPSHAQVPPSTFEVHGEAFAIGASIISQPWSSWSAGIDVSVGKHAVVNITDEGDRIDTYATGYVVARWTPDYTWQVALSPIGFAGILGDDFGTVYPSARLGAYHFWGRTGLGFELRVARIAGSFGSGEYWVQLVPVRVAIRL